MSAEQTPMSAPVHAVVMPVVDSCPICNTAFTDHMGVIGLCEKLTRLIAAADDTVRSLHAEFGNTGLEANFKPLLEALDHARGVTA